jgi:hypothetical protein
MIKTPFPFKQIWAVKSGRVSTLECFWDSEYCPIQKISLDVSNTENTET